MKVKNTIDKIKLKSSLKNNQILLFTKRSFFCTFLGFTQSHSAPQNDIDGYIQLIPCTYKSDKPIKITGVDKLHLNCGCVDGSSQDGVRQPILYSFALDKPTGHKIIKEPTIKLLKKVNKPVLSHITFYLEDDDHKPVDFIDETIRFTCQLNKIKNFFFDIV